MVDSIYTRLPHGLPNSPRDDDFADESLAERNPLTFSVQASIDACPEPATQPWDYVSLSKQYVSNGEDVYRTLSSLVHGQAWAVVPAFDIKPQGDGHYTRWRSYPLTLHSEMALSAIEFLAMVVAPLVNTSPAQRVFSRIHSPN